MGIFDRLGNVLKSYLHDEDSRVSGSDHLGGRRQDPDLEAAFEELDEFLNPGKTGASFKDDAKDDAAGSERSYRKPAGGQVPESLRPDFAELGLPLGASPEECKAAYKKLLKLHHPDRHAGHPGNMKKATEKSARINAAFDRIEKWRRTGGVD
jgi:DnaJ-domain-containing protein 1